MTAGILHSSRPLHLLMRYSDKFSDNTIAAHLDVVSRKGSVWLGKMGKTLARRHVKTLNEQCSNKIPTYVFLVQRLPGGYEVYQARLAEVSRSFPEDQKLIPPYYDKQKITSYIRLWQRVTAIKKIDSAVLKRLHIATSGSSAADTIRQSMAALFIVRQS
jgi:hypothetical protein